MISMRIKPAVPDRLDRRVAPLFEPGCLTRLRESSGNAGVRFDEMHPFLDQLRPFCHMIEPGSVEAVKDTTHDRLVSKSLRKALFGKCRLIIEGLEPRDHGITQFRPYVSNAPSGGSPRPARVG